MDHEGVLPHHTVVVKAGQIVAFGPNETVLVPVDAQRIDGRGRYLMPGLADMHVHFMRPAPIGKGKGPGSIIGSSSPSFSQENDILAVLYVANGVTSVRNMWGHPEIDALGKRIQAGVTLGPHIYSTGPLNDGKPISWRGSREIKNRQQAREGVRADKEAGYVATKVYDGLTKESYEALVAEARKEHLPVVGHVPDAVGYNGVLAAHQDSIEHIEYPLIALWSDNAGPVKYDENLLKNIDLKKLPDLASRQSAAGSWLCPTLAAFRQPLTDPEWLEFQKLVPPAILKRYEKSYVFTASSPLHTQEARTFYLAILSAFHKAGVGLLLGTDAHKPGALPGFSIDGELADFVAAGLTPYDAIRAGTSDAARFLHRETEFGTIAIGHRADLLLLSANPLEDIVNVQKREGVMVQGSWLTEEVLKSKLQGIARLNALDSQPK
jgi:imidazolonepropionase-like amidohydrolase